MSSGMIAGRVSLEDSRHRAVGVIVAGINTGTVEPRFLASPRHGILIQSLEAIKLIMITDGDQTSLF